MVHTTSLERLKEEKPGEVRKYLTQLKDYTALREWDNAQLKES